MDGQIEELIEVGAAVTANCEPCLKYHIAEAQKQGAMRKFNEFVPTIFKASKKSV